MRLNLMRKQLSKQRTVRCWNCEKSQADHRFCGVNRLYFEWCGLMKDKRVWESQHDLDFTVYVYSNFERHIVKESGVIAGVVG